MTGMMPFLMFQRGEAQAAIDFWIETLPDGRIEWIERFGSQGPGPEGTILRGVVSIAGQKLMIHDSFVAHDFDFTPSHSFFVECESRAEIEHLFVALGERGGGKILMPLDDYGWSAAFGWVVDRFGVSWQLDLAPGEGA